MGFPLITITREGNEIVASQERFLLTIENVNSSVRSRPKSKFDYKWYVPLTFITSNDTETVNTMWMNMTDGTTSQVSYHNKINIIISSEVRN